MQMEINILDNGRLIVLKERVYIFLTIKKLLRESGRVECLLEEKSGWTIMRASGRIMLEMALESILLMIIVFMKEIGRMDKSMAKE